MGPEDSLLAELRDIHLPSMLSWWPPAIGWWFLLVLLIAAGLVILQFCRRGHDKPVMSKDAAFDELEKLSVDFSGNGDTHGLLTGLSALLRRTAMTLDSRREVAALTGESWLKWLDEKAGRQLFTDGSGRLLADMHYRPNAKVDADAVLEVCREWLTAVFEQSPPQNRA